MDFSLLTWDETARYRDHVEARVPIDLADLAFLLHRTDGSLSAMDASLDSLVPLWEWVSDVIAEGARIVPDGMRVSVRPDVMTGIPDGTDDGLVGRQFFIAQCVESYVLLVCRRVDPSAKLVVSQNRNLSDSLGRPCIQFAGGQLFNAGYMIARLAYRVDKRWDVDSKSAAALRRFVLLWSNGGLVDVSQERLPSVLAPLVAESMIPADDPRRHPPVFDGKPLPVSEAEGVPTAGEPPYLYESEVTLARGPAEGLGDIDLFDPLPLEETLGFLRGLGFEPMDAGTAGTVVRGNTEFALSDTVLLMTAGSQGILRALFFERAGATDGEWRELCERLDLFARSVGAHFGPEDGWPE